MFRCFDPDDGLNQYTSAGPATFSYDGKGNLTSDGTRTYSYDAENRLVTAVSGGVTTNLTYDPLGRLFQVDQGTGATTTRFLYDGSELAAEYNGLNAMTKRYYFGPGEDEPILEDTGGALNCSGTKFLHTNQQGSIVALADCVGNQTNVNSYDEYGIPGSSNSGRFQYTGQMWLGELGMYYYKNRIYSPTLGRFLQTDPIGYDGDGPNLYAYVSNDPVNLVDPLGLATGSGCGGPSVAGPQGSIIVNGCRLDSKPSSPVPANVQGGGNPNGSMHGGGGAGTGQKQQPKDTSIAHCALIAANAHKGQIAVDILSAVPAGKVAALAGKTLSATAKGAISAGQWHLAFGSGLLSAVHGDSAGATLAATGYGAVIADVAKEGSTFVPVVGAVVAGASVVNDVFGSDEYNACRAGK